MLLLCSMVLQGSEGTNHTKLMWSCALLLTLVVLSSSRRFVIVEPQQLMQPCRLLLAFVVHGRSRRFSRVEPHQTHASLWLPTCSCCALLAQDGSVGSNHTKCMRACGLLLTLIVHCRSRWFGRVEPHLSHASLSPATCYYYLRGVVRPCRTF